MCEHCTVLNRIMSTCRNVSFFVVAAFVVVVLKLFNSYLGMYVGR